MLKRTERYQRGGRANPSIQKVGVSIQEYIEILSLLAQKVD